MIDLKDEILAFFSKWLALLFYLFIGLVGKLSYHALYGKKMSWLQVLGSIGLGLFAGFLSWVICVNRGYDSQIGWVVPITTLLSEKLVVAVTSIDFKGFFATLLDKWLKK